MPRRKALAFSLLEAMAAAGLIAGVTGVMYAVFQPTWSSGEVAGETSRLEKLRRTVPGYYAAATDFQGVATDPILAPLIQHSPWRLSLQAASIYSPSDGWSAVYTAVPTKACIGLVNQEMGREWTSISIDGLVINDAPRGITLCETSDTHGMVFSMWGGARGMAGFGVVLPPGFPTRPPSPPGVPMPPPIIPSSPSPPAPSGWDMPPTTPAPTPVAPVAPFAPPVYPPLPPPPGYPPVCVVPSDQTQTVACPAGQIQSVPPYGTDGISQQRTASCTYLYGVVVWGPWTTTSDTCAPECMAPGPATGTQPASCPSGQVINTGASTFTQVQTVTHACPAPTGAYTTTYGAWTPTVASVCAPKCVAPAPSTAQNYRWVSANPGCPAGQTGTFTYQYRQVQTVTTQYSCPTPQGNFTSSASASGWSNTGETQNVVNTCTPIPPPPPVCVPYGQAGGPVIQSQLMCIIQPAGFASVGVSSTPPYPQRDNYGPKVTCQPSAGTLYAQSNGNLSANTSSGWFRATVAFGGKTYTAVYACTANNVQGGQTCTPQLVAGSMPPGTGFGGLFLARYAGSQNQLGAGLSATSCP